jgi:hypothetical protein
MDNGKQTPVPASRMRRMVKLGKLAGGVAATAMNRGARQLAVP